VDFVVIEGVKPWDGRYPFDIADSPLTTREWGWIKRLSGNRPGDLEDGFRGTDPELFCVFAVIALRRAGKLTNPQVPDVFDKLIDAPFGTTIRLEGDTTEKEEPDPDPDPSGSSNGNTIFSGTDSPTSSERSERPTLAPTGTRGSASLPSTPTRSAT
jgi:hypothetical protein